MKIVIFGNSGSGKSTLAARLSKENKLAHLDLDTLAWQATRPPQRKPVAESKLEIDNFLSQNHSWAIEGCYSDLIKLVVPHSTEMIYLNLPGQDCIANAKRRPWEPHKYASKAEQDANLGMLIEFISDYEKRQDTFSKALHFEIYQNYPGKKTMLVSNDQASACGLKQ